MNFYDWIHRVQKLKDDKDFMEQLERELKDVGDGQTPAVKRKIDILKRELLKELRAFQTPEDKRKTAYHEAGHAATEWMFGNAWNIHFIDMRGNLDSKAFVRAEGWNLDGFDRNDPVTRNFVALRTKQQMMNKLAGYASENRVNPSDYGDWLEEQVEVEGYIWDENNPNDMHDMARALRAAKNLRGDNGNAWRLLRQMASWTDEALSHPKLWGVVEALAERLVTVKARMSGITACGIMNSAWRGSTLPYMEMGRKWCRRFSLRKGR